MYDKKIEYLTEKERFYADLSEGNEVIVETAGFVPLEVKLKRFEQNGMLMQFNENEFTSSDLRSIYLNPDFDITPEDDFEEVQEKLYAQQVYKNELKKKTSGIVEDNPEVAPQAETEKNSTFKKESVNENQEE